MAQGTPGAPLDLVCGAEWGPVAGRLAHHCTWRSWCRLLRMVARRSGQTTLLHTGIGRTARRGSRRRSHCPRRPSCRGVALDACTRPAVPRGVALRFCTRASLSPAKQPISRHDQRVLDCFRAAFAEVWSRSPWNFPSTSNDGSAKAQALQIHTPRKPRALLTAVTKWSGWCAGDRRLGVAAEAARCDPLDPQACCQSRPIHYRGRRCAVYSAQQCDQLARAWTNWASTCCVGCHRLSRELFDGTSGSGDCRRASAHAVEAPCWCAPERRHNHGRQRRGRYEATPSWLDTESAASSRCSAMWCVEGSRLLQPSSGRTRHLGSLSITQASLRMSPCVRKCVTSAPAFAAMHLCGHPEPGPAFTRFRDDPRCVVT